LFGRIQMHNALVAKAVARVAPVAVYETPNAPGA
jgi:hypothetical protein